MYVIYRFTFFKIDHHEGDYNFQNSKFFIFFKMLMLLEFDFENLAQFLAIFGQNFQKFYPNRKIFFDLLIPKVSYIIFFKCRLTSSRTNVSRVFFIFDVIYISSHTPQWLKLSENLFQRSTIKQRVQKTTYVKIYN